MPKTVPNQRVVKVHRERASADFLGIKNENWQYAARDLGAHALLLYMYFAANADGYTFALSPVAIRQAIGMPPQTYRDQFAKLIDKKYLVQTGGNIYEFYEKPQHEAKAYQKSETNDGYDFTACVVHKTNDVEYNTADNREINKINTINSINNAQEKQVSLADTFIF